jgi:hypothetical protein
MHLAILRVADPVTLMLLHDAIPMTTEANSGKVGTVWCAVGV